MNERERREEKRINEGLGGGFSKSVGRRKGEWEEGKERQEKKKRKEVMGAAEIGGRIGVVKAKAG